MSIKGLKATGIFKIISSWIIVSVILSTTITPQAVYGQPLDLPAPGVMIQTTPDFMPVMMKGLRVHADNPLLFDFILDSGKSGLKVDSPEFKMESQKLIRYFLAALTIKEDDLWVNLSPYEKDRMISEELGQTELGRDMLAQDYILKQLTASLIYPEKELGKSFWDRVYAKAREQFGTTDIPVDTFNKVWIVANKAKVLERNNAAYVVGAHLKVMLESDYVAQDAVGGGKKSLGRDASDVSGRQTSDGTQAISKQIIREIVIPEIEKEVNVGQNFAPLRQMFYSMILASWYKLALQDALLNQVYSNKAKTGGVLSDDQMVKYKIYEQYLQAYQKGVFNYIKEDVDAASQEPVPHKYFSGGERINVPEVLERASSLAPEDNATAVGDLAMLTVSVDKIQKSDKVGRLQLENKFGETVQLASYDEAVKLLEQLLRNNENRPIDIDYPLWTNADADTPFKSVATTGDLAPNDVVIIRKDGRVQILSFESPIYQAVKAANVPAVMADSVFSAIDTGNSLDAAMGKGKTDASNKDSVAQALASLRQLYAAQSLYSGEPSVRKGIDAKILDLVNNMVLNWYEVKSGRPLRYYRMGDLVFSSQVIKSSPSGLGMDIREDINKTIAALVTQVASKQLVDGSLIVTEFLHPKDSDIKAFFAARNQSGGYELGFVRNNASPVEANVFVLTTGAGSQENIEALLTKLGAASMGRKRDKKAAGRDDYQDIKDKMVKAAGELGAGAVHKIITTPEVNYPAFIRGYSAVRGASGYTLEITYNLGPNSTQKSVMWEDLPLLDEKIVNGILSELDTAEARADIESWVKKYYANEQAETEAQEVLSDLVKKIVSNTVEQHTRYWYEESPGGVRYYKGNAFFEQMPLTVMTDVNVLPEGIKVDQDSELMRTFIDHLNDDLTADGYVPSSLVLAPVQGQDTLKFIYAVRLGEQYRFGLVTNDFYDFVFLPVQTADVTRVEGILNALNTPAITQQFADVLKAGKANIDTASDLTGIAKAMLYERLVGLAVEDNEMGPINPQKLLKSTPASPESLLRHFYAEPTAEGFSIGMSVQPKLQHRTLEYLTLSNKYLPFYPDTIQQILDSLEIKGRATIESLVVTHADVVELGAEVDKTVQAIVDEVLDKIERESNVLKVGEYAGAQMPVDIVDNGVPTGRLFSVQLQRDVPTFVVAGKPTLNGEIGSAAPFVLVQGVAQEIVDKTVATLSSRYSDRLKRMNNLEDKERQVLKGDIQRSFDELIRKNVAANALQNAQNGTDAAMKSPGGIDFNAKNMGLDIAKDGKGVEIKFDPAMVAEFQQGDFTGLQGVILRIVPVQSPLSILGLAG